MNLRSTLPVFLAVAILVPAAIGVTLASRNVASAAPVSPSTSARAPVVDVKQQLAPVRAEVQKLASAAPTPAPTPGSAALRGGVVSANDADRSVERLTATATLTERIYAARDERRKAGQSGAELRKPFAFDELGKDVVTSLALSDDARWLVQRDGKVVWPVGKSLPEGASFGDDKKGATAASGALLRFCPYGEPMCLVDFAKPALVPLTAAPATSASLDVSAALASVDAAEASLASSLASSSPASSSPAAAPPSGRAPIAAILGALIAAIAGIALLAPRVRKIGDELTALAGRAAAMAAGRGAEPLASDTAEVHALATALVNASKALEGAGARATLDERRRARSVEIASALSQAASLTDLTVRVPHTSLTTTLPPGDAANGNGSGIGDVDDAALRTVVDSANALLEAIDRRVLRWRSHADAMVPRQANASALEKRAEALKPFPQLLSDVSARLLRASLVAGVPANVHAEMKTLAEALGERAKTGQSLVDALLLDLATERPGARADQALDQLRAELAATKTSASSMDRVAALGDLPPAEIAERIAPEAE